MVYEYVNLQFRTVPAIGIWSKIDERDLETRQGYPSNGWLVYHTINIKGSMAITAHVLFMLRRAT